MTLSIDGVSVRPIRISRSGIAICGIFKPDAETTPLSAEASEAAFQSAGRLACSAVRAARTGGLSCSAKAADASGVHVKHGNRFGKLV